MSTKGQTPTELDVPAGSGAPIQYHRLAEKLADNLCMYLRHPIGGPTWQQAVVEAQHVIDQLEHTRPNAANHARSPNHESTK